MYLPTLVTLFFLFTPLAFPYTVITTSGKRIQGTLISDQPSTILVKDSSGVLISFKKQILDLEAMAIANAPSPASKKGVQVQEKAAPPSIVQLAADLKAQRKGNSKSFTMDDLDEMPDISVLGSESTGDLPQMKSHASQQGKENWGARILAVKKEVSRLREKKITAESSCDQTRQKQYAARTTPSEKPSNLLSTYKESSQCKKMEEIGSQLADAERRLEDLREEARRAGASWQDME